VLFAFRGDSRGVIRVAHHVWYQMNSIFINYPLIINDYDMQKELTLIYTGRLSTHKNIYQLFDIYNTISNKFNNTKLIIIGNGPEYDNIVKNNSTNPNIIIRGLILNEKLYEEYASYSNPCFIFPSTTETLGKSPIEASLCGIPVFTAISDETEYLYNDGITGYTFNNVKECCNKIEIFLSKTSEEKNKFLNNAKKHFKSIFKKSIDKISNLILSNI
jgi:glycosyltransferase involved in cell wall biosynthesis